MIFNIGVPPNIDEGPFIPVPDTKKLEDLEVKIGSPAYIVIGYKVIMVCNILTGTPPITITWLYNGAPDPSRGNVSTITVTDNNNGDVFTCRAENNIGFDMESTTINVCGK